uniref:Integration host factor subunit beta n=2 Tax=Aquisalinus luteolus TaxID=1566827 RepID=A0A8J3ER86_9PROT|nr:hypothetical protein GCM10011355_21550 [Aquisalinus luteolus]
MRLDYYILLLNGPLSLSRRGHLMIKSELVQKLAEDNPHLFTRDIERIVATVFDEISTALANGDRVELRGFGAFSVKHREARIGRNPRTGEAVAIEEKWTPFFKAGKEMRERLNKPQNENVISIKSQG